MGHSFASIARPLGFDNPAMILVKGVLPDLSGVYLNQGLPVATPEELAAWKTAMFQCIHVVWQ